VLGVDGHALDPDLWITMERRKHEAGYMRPYLIQAGGRTVGAVCAAPCGNLLRMKNLFIDRAHRRRGLATATASAFARLAGDEGLAAVGCFALEGGPALDVYPKAGYGASTKQTEWVRDLP
jgi:GNAT superfamily N-acetyltransferase